MERQQIMPIHQNLQLICANRETDNTNTDFFQLTKNFSIYQNAILLAFIKGFTFRKTAKEIGLSPDQLHALYLHMLEVTATKNKKELVNLAKKLRYPKMSNRKNRCLKKEC